MVIRGFIATTAKLQGKWYGMAIPPKNKGYIHPITKGFSTDQLAKTALTNITQSTKKYTYYEHCLNVNCISILSIVSPPISETVPGVTCYCPVLITQENVIGKGHLTLNKEEAIKEALKVANNAKLTFVIGLKLSIKAAYWAKQMLKKMKN